MSLSSIVHAGIVIDHRGRIGVAGPREIGHPTRPATVGVIRPKMDMALKRFAPIGGRKNLACHNLISAAWRKSSVIFQSYSGDHAFCSVIHRRHVRAIYPIEGERQPAGRHFFPIRRVGDDDCRIPITQNSHDRKEQCALGRADIEDIHGVGKNIVEGLSREGDFRRDNWPTSSGKEISSLVAAAVSVSMSTTFSGATLAAESPAVDMSSPPNVTVAVPLDDTAPIVA